MDELFGKPREGFHTLRTPIGDLALNDIIGTVVLSYILSRSFDLNYFKTLGGLFIFGEFLHILFGVKTKVIEKIIN